MMKVMGEDGEYVCTDFLGWARFSHLESHSRWDTRTDASENNLSYGEQFTFSQAEQRTPLLTDSSLWGERFSFNDAVTS